MEELKILSDKLDERLDYLESLEQTKITQGRIAENLFMATKVLELQIPTLSKIKP